MSRQNRIPLYGFAPAPDTSVLGSHTRRVLLIEDDEDDYLLTREYLADFDVDGRYVLEWAQTYEDGIQALLDERHDLCLLDYHLGARDGIGLLREALAHGCRTPIILLTGDGDRDVDRAAMRYGAADYLIKEELSAALLERAMRHSLERSRFAEAQRFLAAASVRLSGSLDLDHILEDIAQLSARVLGDFCVIVLGDEHADAWRTTVGVRDEDDAPLGARLADHNGWPIVERILAGDSVLVGDVDEAFLTEACACDEQRRLLEAMAPVSLVGVPLIARATVLGAITIISARSRRRYDSSDLSLVDQLGYRTALAIDNARLYQEAQRAIEMRDEVHRIVVHDLRNPLNTIGLTTNVMQRRVDQGAPIDTLAPHLRTQRLAAERMQTLLEDLLDVARIENGKLSIDPSRCSAAGLVELVVAQHRVQADDRSVHLAFTLPDDLPMVRADHDRLEQVLSNLVGNALKFTPAGGSIELSAHAQGDWVRFQVADTGCGISPDHLPHLFDRFWQAQHGVRHGAGLGLAICRGIIDAHGGDIWVESDEGAGTIFYFTIPTA